MMIKIAPNIIVSADLEEKIRKAPKPIIRVKDNRSKTFRKNRGKKIKKGNLGR